MGEFRTMKFLLISGIYPPDIGGPAIFIPKLAEFLHNKGHECEVLTLKNHKIQKLNQKWKIHYINRTVLPLRIIKTLASLFCTKKNVSIYFANGLIEEVGLFLFLTGRRGVAKIVGDAVWERARNTGKTHENVTEFNSHCGSFLQRIQRIILVFSLNRFKLVICPSVELRSLVLGWGVRTPTIVIQNGVQVPEDIEFHQKDIDVVAVSRLVSWKNLDSVIMACQQIGATLWVVGDGPEKDYLGQIASRKSSKVIFTGNLDNSKIPKILQRAKIFALYSDYEGLSFALLEAMAHGAVPIVSECEGNIAIIANGINGLTVPLNKPDLLEASILALLLDEKKREHLGVESRRLIQKNYSLEDRLEDYLTFFKELV
jgi:glycosyltransferase involved in cell wall biosynthesis